MGRNNFLQAKSYAFAIRIIRLYRYLITEKTEYHLSRQILRSGTAIGALIREAEHAESRKDFIHKLMIALKEANETIYWLELLLSTEFIERKLADSLIKDATELLKILISSIKTLKQGGIQEERSGNE